MPSPTASLPVWLPTSEDDAFLGHLRRALDSSVELLASGDVPEGASPRVLVRGVPTPDQLAACPSLERLVIPYAGVPKATRELLRKRPEVAVHNLHHNAASTAELAIALLLACAKDVLSHDQDLRRGDWSRRYREPSTATLSGGHAVVLGYGEVGQRVARTLGALGMRVSAVRRSARPGDRHGMVGLAPTSALPRLLPTADALVVCLPLTEATRGLLDAGLLGMLPSGAYLVNVGRGALIDERALYRLLAARRIAGAGIDVWYRYPADESARDSTAPSEYPFHELDNVVLSPHRAGLTRHNEEARANALAALLHAAARGAPVGNRVDLELGY